MPERRQSVCRETRRRLTVGVDRRALPPLKHLFRA
jgi:hypothetical protein